MLQSIANQTQSEMKPPPWVRVVSITDEAKPGSRKVVVANSRWLGKSRCRFYERITKGQAAGPFAANVQRVAHIHWLLSGAMCSLPRWLSIDDMTPEAIGFVQELLFQKGALDVYTIPIGMKKSRPGVLLMCMCRREVVEEMTALLFRHTTTLGVREIVSRRYTLHRETHTVPTLYGPVAVKASTGWGITKSKAEYEDVARIAREHGLSLAEVRALLGQSREPAPGSVCR